MNNVIPIRYICASIWMLLILSNSISYADITWNPTSSTYGGITFTSLGSGEGRTASSTAFGKGFATSGVFKFFSRTNKLLKYQH